MGTALSAVPYFTLDICLQGKSLIPYFKSCQINKPLICMIFQGIKRNCMCGGLLDLPNRMPANLNER